MSAEEVEREGRLANNEAENDADNITPAQVLYATINEFESDYNDMV